MNILWALIFALLLLPDGSSGEVPRVALGGKYASTYYPLLDRLGVRRETLEPAQLREAAALRPFSLVLVSHLERWLTPEEEGGLRAYLEGGGKVFLELASFPSAELLPGEVIQGWSPDVRVDVPEHPLFERARGVGTPPHFRYGMWGAGILTSETETRRILARWFVPPGREYAGPRAEGFAREPAALVVVRVGKGELVYGGAAFAFAQGTRPLAEAILVYLLGEENLPLLGLEEAVRTPVEPAPCFPTPLAGRIREGGTAVGIFREPGFPRRGLPEAVTPEFLAQALRAGGQEVEFLRADDLADPARLNPQRVRALVLSYGEAVPAEALPNLKRYLAAGGGLVCPAGVPLSHPCLRRDGRWVEVAAPRSDSPNALSEGIAYLLFKHLLPLGKAYRAQKPPVRAVVLDAAQLPHLPAEWPLEGGQFGFILREEGAQSQVRPLVAALAADGDVVALPLMFAPRLSPYPAGRLIALGFAGKGHPWNPQAWPHAAAAVRDIVALALRRDDLVLTDVMSDQPLYRPGETVHLTAQVQSAQPGKIIVRLLLRERDSDRVVQRAEQQAVLSPPEPTEVAFVWQLPERPAWAYEAVVSAERGEGEVPPAVERTLFLVWNGEIAQRAPEFALGEDGVARLDGKPVWLSGFNLYTNDARGIGAFFDSERRLGKHPLPEVWDRDLSLLHLFGGNAIRQHYYERILNAAVLGGEGPDDWPVRVLDAVHLLLAYHRVVAFADPFTFSPVHYWRRRLGEGDPYTDEKWLGEEMAYYEALARHCAPFRNIAWELINEAEGYGRNAATSEERRRVAEVVARWARQAREKLAAGGFRFVGLGQTFATNSPLWNLRGNLRCLDWSNIHCYGALDARASRWCVPLGLNFGRPCLIGEAGMPNAGSSAAAFLGQWADYYDRLLHFALGERALGFTNFYLNNPLTGTDNPEWGLLRHDGTEKEIARLWKRWNFLLRHLPPEEYLPPTVGLFVSAEAALDDPRLLDRLAEPYLQLLEQGIPPLILSEYDLLESRSAASGVQTLEVLLVTPEQKQYVPAGFQTLARSVASGVQTPTDFAFAQKPARYVYPLRKRDGGLTVVLVGGTGEPGDLQFRGHRIDLRVPPKRCAVVDFLADGRPRLVEAYGEVTYDGQPLVRAPAELGYVLVADGESLVEGTATVWSDDPAAVQASCPPRHPLRELAGAMLLAAPELREAAEALRRALQERGLSVGAVRVTREASPFAAPALLLAPVGHPLAQRELARREGLGVTMEGIPTFHWGPARLQAPWTGAILTRWVNGRPLVLLTGLTPGAVNIALHKFSRLRRLSSYFTAPFAPEPPLSAGEVYRRGAEAIGQRG